MENINTIVIKKISPAETLKSIAVGETRLIKSKAIKENVVRATMSRLNQIINLGNYILIYTNYVKILHYICILCKKLLY